MMVTGIYSLSSVLLLEDTTTLRLIITAAICASDQVSGLGVHSGASDSSFSYQSHGERTVARRTGIFG